MGPFATAVLTACLAALRILFYATAALALIALAFQALRGDLVSPSPLIAVIIAGLLLGAACSFVGRRMSPRQG